MYEYGEQKCWRAWVFEAMRAHLEAVDAVELDGEVDGRHVEAVAQRRVGGRGRVEQRREQVRVPALHRHVQRRVALAVLRVHQLLEVRRHCATTVELFSFTHEYKSLAQNGNTTLNVSFTNHHEFDRRSHAKQLEVERSVIEKKHILVHTRTSIIFLALQDCNYEREVITIGSALENCLRLLS